MIFGFLLYLLGYVFGRNIFDLSESFRPDFTTCSFSRGTPFDVLNHIQIADMIVI